MQQPAPDENQPQLTAEDRLLLASLARGGEWLRALLCTLARRGVALRTASPARARALLDALAPLPLYKGGQFLFDLLEWEDFMLDGPEPPILPTTLDGRALAQIAAQLGGANRRPRRRRGRRHAAHLRRAGSRAARGPAEARGGVLPLPGRGARRSASRRAVAAGAAGPARAVRPMLTPAHSRLISTHIIITIDSGG
jgi:hypothetical protein